MSIFTHTLHTLIIIYNVYLCTRNIILKSIIISFMKQRLLLFALTLLMAVVGSVSVHAANWSVKVKGVQVTDENALNPLGDGSISFYKTHPFTGESNKTIYAVIKANDAAGKVAEFDCGGLTFIDHYGSENGICILSGDRNLDLVVKNAKNAISSYGDVTFDKKSNEKYDNWFFVSFKTTSDAIVSGNNVKFSIWGFDIKSDAIAVNMGGTFYLNVGLSCAVQGKKGAIKGASKIEYGSCPNVKVKTFCDRYYNPVTYSRKAFRDADGNEVYKAYFVNDVDKKDDHLYGKINIEGLPVTTLNKDDVMDDGGSVTVKPYTHRDLDSYWQPVLLDSVLVSLKDGNIASYEAPAIEYLAEGTKLNIVYHGNSMITSEYTTKDYGKDLKPTIYSVSPVTFSPLNADLHPHLTISAYLSRGCIQAPAAAFLGHGDVECISKQTSRYTTYGTPIFTDVLGGIIVGSKLTLTNKDLWVKDFRFFASAVAVKPQITYMGTYHAYNSDGALATVNNMGNFCQANNSSKIEQRTIVMDRTAPIDYNVTLCGQPLNSFNHNRVVEGISYDYTHGILKVNNATIDNYQGDAIVFTNPDWDVDIEFTGNNNISATGSVIHLADDAYIRCTGRTVLSAGKSVISLMGHDLTITGAEELILMGQGVGIQGSTGTETVYIKSSNLSSTNEQTFQNVGKVKLTDCVYTSASHTSKVQIQTGTTYNLTVGGEQVTTANMNNIKVYGNNGSIRFVYNEDEPSVLYLTDANIANYIEGSTLDHGPKNLKGLASGLKIICEGKNTIGKSITFDGGTTSNLVIECKAGSANTLLINGRISAGWVTLNGGDITIDGSELQSGVSNIYATLLNIGTPNKGDTGVIRLISPGYRKMLSVGTFKLYDDMRICIPQDGKFDSSEKTIVDNNGSYSFKELYLTNVETVPLRINGREVPTSALQNILGDGQVSYNPVTNILSLGTSKNVVSVECPHDLTLCLESYSTINTQKGPCINITDNGKLTISGSKYVTGDLELNNEDLMSAAIECGELEFKTPDKGQSEITINAQGMGLNLHGGVLTVGDHYEIHIDKTVFGTIMGVSRINTTENCRLYGPWGMKTDYDMDINNTILPLYNSLTYPDGVGYRGRVAITWRGLYNEPISVDGMQLTELNWDDVLEDGGSVWWDVDREELHFKDANINATYNRAVQYWGTSTQRVCFEGENNIHSNDEAGFTAVGNIAFSGADASSTLNISSDKADGIIAIEDLRVTYGSLNVSGGTTGLYNRDGEGYLGVSDGALLTVACNNAEEGGFGNIIGFKEIIGSTGNILAPANLSLVAGKGVCDGSGDIYISKENPVVIGDPELDPDGILSAASQQDDAATRKVLRAGQILIIRGDNTYTTTGVRVE